MTIFEGSMVASITYPQGEVMLVCPAIQRTRSNPLPPNDLKPFTYSVYYPVCN